MRIVALVVLSALFLPVSASAKDVVLKVATLAPEGSTWWKIMKEGDKRLKEATQGRVSIRLYAGGVAGDEPDVVRKMRVGQLHGGAITSVGLSEIQPAALVLQAPGLASSWAELDGAREALRTDIEKLLADKGYIVLMWGDVGFNRFFSNAPVKGPTDLKSTKPWCWTQDGVYQALYSTLGVTPVPLGVPDVLPGLQTGLLDAFSTPPLAAVSLQWFSKAKYMLDMPVNVTLGAIVLTTKSLELLSPEDRATVARIGKELTPVMADAVRADNDKSLEAIKKSGVIFTPVDAATKKAWDEAFKRGADAAAGKVYPPELLAKARGAVEAMRKGK
jgi:TRAP-type transport system periplasmic protein